MEKEVGATVEMGVSMFIMAAMVGLMSYFIYQGIETKRDVYTQMRNVQSEIVQGELIELAGLGDRVEMPTATLITIVERNKRVIEELVSHVENNSNCDLLSRKQGGLDTDNATCSTMNNDINLRELLLKGYTKVGVVVTYDKYTQMYRVHIVK